MNVPRSAPAWLGATAPGHPNRKVADYLEDIEIAGYLTTRGLAAMVADAGRRADAIHLLELALQRGHS
jgi:hypothetical protein